MVLGFHLKYFLLIRVVGVGFGFPVKNVLPIKVVMVGVGFSWEVISTR